MAPPYPGGVCRRQTAAAYSKCFAGPAAATDHTMTDFILDSAVEHAQRVLADRRWFSASEEQFEEFVRLLDAPLPSTSKFDKLFARPSRFTDPE